MIKIDSKYFSPVYTTQPCFPLLPSIKTLDRDLHKIPFKFSLQGDLGKTSLKRSHLVEPSKILSIDRQPCIGIERVCIREGSEQRAQQE